MYKKTLMGALWFLVLLIASLLTLSIALGLCIGLAYGVSGAGHDAANGTIHKFAPAIVPTSIFCALLISVLGTVYERLPGTRSSAKPISVSGNLILLAATLVSIGVVATWTYISSRRSQYVEQITPLRVLEGGRGASSDSGLNGPGVVWIDNWRLVVVGALATAADNHENRGQSEKALYLWDMQHATYTKLSDLDPDVAFTHLCSSGGRIWYVREASVKDNYLTYREGTPGFEVESRVPLRGDGAFSFENGQTDGYFFNRFSCMIQSTRKTLRPEHRTGWLLKYLRKDDGYLLIAQSQDGDISQSEQNSPVQLVRPDGMASISLPIMAKEMAWANLEYSTYTNEYILTPVIPSSGNSHAISWPYDLPRVSYFLRPEGTVHKVNYPLEPHLRDYWGLPTVQGMFLTGDYPYIHSAWLYKSDKVTRLFGGTVDAKAVSPDGCKVAMTKLDGKDFEPLTILDFCRAKESLTK
jgi:hypothetical protein